MQSLSLFDENFYSYKIEKRRYERVDYSQYILHPLINGQKSNIGDSHNDFFIKIMSLSEGGIGLVSNFNLSVGDFLYFVLYIDGSPSFEVLSIVKWVGFSDVNLIAGCEFINLKSEYSNIIRNYVNKKSLNQIVMV